MIIIIFRQCVSGGCSDVAALSLARPSPPPLSHRLPDSLCSSGSGAGTRRPSHHSHASRPVAGHHQPPSHHQAFSQLSQVRTCVVLIVDSHLVVFTWALTHTMMKVTELFRCFVRFFNRKMKKSSTELTDKMDALSLNELSPTKSRANTEQRLAQLENVFSFPTADSSSFPQSHCQEFTQQLQHLPPGEVITTFVLIFVKTMRSYYIKYSYYI